MQKSFYPKEGDIQRNWVLVDLKGRTLGRVATEIADILRGKNKPTFTPSVDMGDFVVAINASQIKLTGKKLTDKIYYHHSGFRGSTTETPAGKILTTKPEILIEKAVKGMLPKNKTQQHFMKKLKIYAGAEHPHVAQFGRKEKKDSRTPPKSEA